MQLTLTGLLLFLPGCSAMGLDNPFVNDPFTGGTPATHSSLLNIPLSSGWQLYPSHGYLTTAPDGNREGLETFRSSIAPQSAAIALFNTLSAQGWQLRLALQKGDRRVYLYQKGERQALLCFRRQGMLTILELWSGAALPDGSSIFTSEGSGADELPAFEAEEFGPAHNEPQIETWGGTLQEREL